MNKQTSISAFMQKTNSNVANGINTSDYLKKKLATTENLNDDIDTNEIDELKKELEVCQEKLKLSEKKLKIAQTALKQAAALGLEKDLKIHMLEKKLSIQDKSMVHTNSFRKFGKHFTQDELKSIRSVKSGSRYDSTFISKIVESLYKMDLASLNNKSVTGRGRSRNVAKTTITPEKTEIIQNMLKERVQTEEDPAIQERLERVGTHLNNAIQNILRKKLPTTTSQATTPSTTENQSTSTPSQPTVSASWNATVHQGSSTPVNFSNQPCTSTNANTSMNSYQTFSIPTNQFVPYQPPYTFSTPPSSHPPHAYVYSTPRNEDSYPQTLV